MFKYNFSFKFYLGIVIIILSFVIGNLMKLFFVLFFFDKLIMWLSVIIYILSWIMLAWGIWWAGKETYEALKKYFSYRYYHESVKKGAKRAYHKTRHVSSKVGHRVKSKVKSKVRGRVKNKVEGELKDSNNGGNS